MADCNNTSSLATDSDFARRQKWTWTIYYFGGLNRILMFTSETA